MRPWARILLSLTLLAAVGLGLWVYLNHPRLDRQWAAYQVGTAVTFHQARRELVRLEQRADHQAQVRELAAKWGTGNSRYDLFLAQYVMDPASSETMRKTFSLELSWRPQLLPRWAHFWRWRPDTEPDARIPSILEYLDVLLLAAEPRDLAWREVLDLQAIFQIAGRPDLAARLKPENWQARYQGWRSRPQPDFPHVPRPENPFPDWNGPIPP